METPLLSEAELYDILLKQEAELRPKAERMWEMIKIDPERWDVPKYGSGSASFWVVGLIGKCVLRYNEIEGEFGMSNFDTYGQMVEESFGPDVLKEIMEMLIHKVDGEQGSYS